MSHKWFKFDGDTLLSQVLLYLLLAGYIATIYALVLIVIRIGRLTSIKDPFISPWWGNLIIIAIVAFTLWPVRRWLQSQINVLIYGQHDDPYVLISQVNQQLHLMTSPQNTLPAVAETIARTLKLPYLVIETHHNDSPLQIEFGRQPAGATLTPLPLLYLDRPMGELKTANRRANEALSEGDISLLRDVAQQIGIALHATELTAELQASRERLVLAREEERRRLRRDLHDGLGPQLASQTLTLNAIGKLLERDPAKARELLDHLQTQSQAAIEDIRRLVYALRPPALDELGLVGALREGARQYEQAGGCVEITTDPQPLPPLPAAVEVAVYRIAQEALTNVVRHTEAKQCRVGITVQDHHLDLTIADNGPGFPPEFHFGVGLNSMRERAEELGGYLRFDNQSQGGARVKIWLPLAGGEE